MDYTAHNAEVKRVWDAFNAGAPVRVPMVLGVNARYYMPIKEVNPEGIEHEAYAKDAALMLRMQMRFNRYMRMNIPADHEMGAPREGWSAGVDFQNYYEAAWLGNKVIYIEGNVPDTLPQLNDDNKRSILDRGIPAPQSGIMGTALEYYERMLELAKTERLDGLPPVVSLPYCTMSTDGPFTIACELRGAAQMCIELYEDPEYACALLDLITDAAIERVRYWRKAFGLPERSPYGYADDSVALLSPDMYRAFVLPRHRRLIEALGDGSPPSIHLCGDASHLFLLLRDELGINAFDTGFPLEHGRVVQALGPGVRMNGGPHVDLLRLSSPDAVAAETRRILREVMPHTRRFVMREGNNLAPGTPLANLWAMYNAVREFGAY